MTGASSEVSCSATTSSSPSPASSLEASTTSSRRSRRDTSDVVRRGDRDPDLVAGHDRDVVDREHVGGVGHRDEQGAFVGEGDRHRLVALGDGRAHEVGGGHVHREDREVEMIQAVALSQSTGEPVVSQ